MSSEKISNEMIFELLKGQHEDLRDLKQDFRRLDDKFDRMDQRTRKLEDKIDGIRLSWSQKLVGGILATSAVTSAIVAYAVVVIS